MAICNFLFPPTLLLIFKTIVNNYSKLKYKLIILYVILIIFSSCKNKGDGNTSNDIPTDSWTDFNQLTGTWVELERDSSGHFVYDPCDGDTPSVKITKDSIVLRHQIETPTVLRIDKLEVFEKKISIEASTEGLESNFEFKIVEPNSKLILFKWNFIYGKHRSHGKKVITEETLLSKFRLIKDPCDVEKIPNQKFLPVKYD